MTGETTVGRDSRQRESASLDDVTITSPFWDRWRELNREVTLSNQLSKLESRIENLRRAAGLSEGGFEGPYHNDPPVYKWIEAASYELNREYDPELKEEMDEIIDIIAAAQDDDGYLHSYFILEQEPDERWTNLGTKHELFALGHLIEAAVAHHHATGEDSLLDVAIDFADHACETFGPDGVVGYPGHPEVEFALVRLYRLTGDDRYLELATFFVDERGRPDSRFEWEYDNTDQIAGGFADSLYTDDDDEYEGSYSQDHAPVRETDTVEGHAVKAAFLYAGATAIASETGDETLVDAVTRLWENMRYKRMYVTGGIGSVGSGEAFGDDYELPNEEAYAETCAAFGNIMWSQQMLELSGESRFADTIERTLYNGFLAGISLDGTRFCYTNPLAHNDDERHRREWYHTSCCPPNVARLLASLEQYVYSFDDGTVYVDQYIGSRLDTDVAGEAVTIEQQTEYPYDDQVEITVTAEEQTSFGVAVRIPEWCDDPTVRVDGEVLDTEVGPDSGYVHIDRTWGDEATIELDLTLSAEQIVAHPEIDDDAGKVALRRGPVVYCVENVDSPRPPSYLQIPTDLETEAQYKSDLLEGIVTLDVEATAPVDGEWEDELYRRRGAVETEPVTAQAIPYYAWDNREPGEMRVWLRTDG